MNRLTQDILLAQDNEVSLSAEQGACWFVYLYICTLVEGSLWINSVQVVFVRMEVASVMQFSLSHAQYTLHLLHTHTQIQTNSTIESSTEIGMLTAHPHLRCSLECQSVCQLLLF